jgi:hypothetical protein
MLRAAGGDPVVARQVRFNRVPVKVPEKVCEALVQSQVRFNRVPVKVPVKVWEALVGSHVRFNGFRRRLRKRRFWESLVQGQVRFHRFSRGFPALGFAAHGSERSFFRIIMNKILAQVKL